MTRLFRLFPLALVLAACPPTLDTGDGGEDNTLVVGPEGGLFVRAGYALDVPRGAFAAEERIFVTITDTGIPDVPMRARISLGYRLSPGSLSPKAPLTLYLPWLPERVPAGVDPGTFDMRRQSGTEAYAELPGTRTNTVPFEAVEAKIDKLGLFWLTSPSQPNVARLELEPAEVQLRVGDTQQFTARVVSPTGATVEVPVTWQVAPARVASIADGGLLTALDPGLATLTAAAGEQRAEAKIAVQGVTPAPATWRHQNPFPTGNDLYGGAVAPGGQGALYAGANGTVLAESPLGEWTRLFSTPGVTLTAVAGTSPDDAVAIGRSGSQGVLVEFKGPTAPPVLRAFPATQISDLTALWFDGTHGMGVGTGNELVLRRAGAWVTEYHPSFEALLSVIGDGVGGFVVVGDLGSLYRWDPTRRVWDSLFDRRLAVKLDAARLVDAATGEAWAVGGNRLWHFVGTGWVAENLPASPRLARATVLGQVEGRVVVGGEASLAAAPLPTAKGLVLLRALVDPGDGGVPEPSWESQPLRGPQIPRGLFSAPGAPARLVGDLGAVWQWDAGAAAFVERSVGFYGDVADVAVIDGDVFAAVNECATVACTERVGQVVHRAASGRFEALGALPVAEPVRAVTARAADEVLVTTDSALFRWDGAAWTSVPIGGLQGPILDLKWCGGTLWGAGEGGTVYQGNVTLLSSAGAFTSRPLTALHCPTAQELWVAGDATLASKTSTGTWTVRASQDVQQRPWHAVWSPGPGEGFAFGDARYGVYWDGVALLPQESTGPLSVDVATGLWGASLDTLYMVGLSSLPWVSGFALRFDGIAWRLVDAGAHRKVTAIDGRAPHDVWLGTEGGGLLQAVPPP